MKLESEIFTNEGKIPVEYTCDGHGSLPALKISEVPESAKSLALIVDDPDAPNGDFVHFVLWNIDPGAKVIDKNNMPMGAVEGNTSLNKPGWVAPCPPFGVHHYNFKLYALDIELSIPNYSNKSDLVSALNEHIIESSTLVGLYGRE